MTREKAVEAYNRVKAWERMASARLMVELRERTGDPGMTPHLLHNWSFDDPKLAKVKRWHDWAQRRVWDESRRLSDAFARHF